MRPHNCNIAPATYLCLTAMEKGLTVTQFAEVRKVNKSSASRFIARQCRLGYVRKLEGTKIFKLTESGKETLRCLRNVFGNCNAEDLLKLDSKLQFRPHHLIFRFKILDHPEDLVKRLVDAGGVATSAENPLRGSLKGYELKEDAGSVFFSTSSVVFYPREVYDGSVYGAMQKALTIAQGLARRLERRFPGLKLDWSADLCRQHIALMGGPTKWIPAGFNYRTDMLVIDSSKDEPEIETVHKKFSFDGMLNLSHFMDKVVRGEISAEQIQENLGTLTQVVANQQKRLDLLEGRP